MTRLACRTQARRVFRQENRIKPHFQHTPQYFSPICRCSGMCKTSILHGDTITAMSLKTEQPRPGAVGQPSREAVRFFRHATLRAGYPGKNAGT
jgi:hypothetical protein